MKKLLVILVALFISLGGASVFADDTKDTSVETTVSEAYTWAITPTLDNGEGTIGVEVSLNTIAFTKQLKITYAGQNDADGKHYLKDGDNEENLLEYSITGFVADNDGTALILPAGDTGSATLTTSIEGTKKFAGTYSDTITFTAMVEEVPEETPEEEPTLFTTVRIGDYANLNDVCETAISNIISISDENIVTNVISMGPSYLLAIYPGYAVVKATDGTNTYIVGVTVTE